MHSCKFIVVEIKNMLGDPDANTWAELEEKIDDFLENNVYRHDNRVVSLSGDVIVTKNYLIQRLQID